MATYKKRGYKKSIAPANEKQVEVDSTTAEVFDKLDTTASRTEEWVSKFQILFWQGLGSLLCLYCPIWAIRITSLNLKNWRQ